VYDNDKLNFGYKLDDSAHKWWWFMSERILEEEVVEDVIIFLFRTNTREVKENLHQQQVKKYGAYRKKV